MPRWVAHVDMDAFFVGVELLRRPELRGKAVIVATGTNPDARGVVMAASYEARRFGVHSALPLATAHRRCPQAILISRDMALYREVSGEVMKVLARHGDCIEVAGLDEAYLDLSDHPFPKSASRKIKHEVKVETGLTCSVGLAPNKLLAKIASDLDKPDGFCLLRQEDFLGAVGDRPASLLPGVGPKTVERLSTIGITTVADLAAGDAGVIERALGERTGRLLRQRAQGIDERRLEPERRRKSESREVTFPSDVADRMRLNDTLEHLARDVCDGLSAGGYRGRTVTLKLRLRPFRTYTRSRTLDAPTCDAEVVRSVARSLLDRFELDAPVRLLGVGVSSLQSGRDDGKPAPEAASELSLEL
jgi:nucleotidyltransferase/DNA polymerase involved in DNA repair